MVMLRRGRCHACKSRKVKCDENVPQCQRCIRAGKSCPGYRKVQEVEFRDMTLFAEKKVEARVHSVLSARTRKLQAAPKCFPITDWREDAVTRFFWDYVLGSDAVLHTTVVLQTLYKISEASSCLKYTLSAVSYVSQANQLHLPFMAAEAKELYGRALRSLARALQDPIESLKDSTLATPYLLGWYEGISGFLPTGTLMDHQHHRGRRSLLLLRSSHQFNSPTGRCLFGLSHEVIINKCLTIHERPLEQTSAWDRAFGERGPAREIEAINILTAQLCAEAQVLFDIDECCGESKSRLLKVIRDADAIDTLYHNWVEEYSSAEVWGYQTLRLLPGPALHADGMVQVHYDFWTAYIWTSCRSKRAHLHEVSLHCLSLLGYQSTADEFPAKLEILGLDMRLVSRSEDIIEEMVSSICATVPFMLGDVDLMGKIPREKRRTPLTGYEILWSLNAALASTRRGSPRDAWIKQRLQFIDTGMGIRFGGLFAQKVMKEPWVLN